MASRHLTANMISRIVFTVLLLASASGLISAPIALVMGVGYGITLPHAYGTQARILSKYLLQLSVVGLGFGMNLHQVVHAGRSGFLYTLLGIGFSLLVGMSLAKLFGVKRVPGFLISTGTAICGGSAIAAIGPITEASDEDMAIALGTVFALNSLGLLIFPVIGTALKMTQCQFGLWAALAIHDTSSVVGAAAKYGAEALGIATTVKLARSLWIVPVVLVTAMSRRKKAKIQWPWFIGFFCLAAACKTYFFANASGYVLVVKAATTSMTATLFLIGTGISVEAIKRVGPRPFLQGIVLWVIVLTLSLWLVRVGWIA
jgi:uncharacterized integral membrane protein (TIGR00698 family)